MNGSELRTRVQVTHLLHDQRHVLFHHVHHSIQVEWRTARQLVVRRTLNKSGLPDSRTMLLQVNARQKLQKKVQIRLRAHVDQQKVKKGVTRRIALVHIRAFLQGRRQPASVTAHLYQQGHILLLLQQVAHAPARLELVVLAHVVVQGMHCKPNIDRKVRTENGSRRVKFSRGEKAFTYRDGDPPGPQSKAIGARQGQENLEIQQVART